MLSSTVQSVNLVYCYIFTVYIFSHRLSHRIIIVPLTTTNDALLLGLGRLSSHFVGVGLGDRGRG